ncbi:MAG: 1-deoxy-D-xylulose-5-phosphate synthase [Agathobaculum sp.]|jgi:1-deoxy-D-xylulose-5-phosphate synthase|uniref:1-deoxy-D-xylulose-5-phosphate synthase n=1 Tax=Agathobaculum sp. TaxID=2048138 RepID=UPI003D8C60CC
MKHYGILDNITGPADLRGLSYESLDTLCASLREFIVDSVSHTGGHLASNLGVVELAVALEREFDSSRDRIVYDVGHQSYVHKILTGRRDRFDTLRQYGGISGFMKPEESITDPCITGHASNSVSVALGMAHARTLKNQKYHVVAVIGDGAMTGGMAYEALNSAGTSGEPLLVILNDNNMSIARNVGGLSRHLSRLRVSPRYLHAKTHVKDSLARIPGGAVVTRLISRCKARLKRIFLPATLFEQMGFTYFGPVDGHDLKSVCELLAQVKGMKKPVLLHVMTQKGRGYAPSEQHPEAYHGVSPFDAEAGLDYAPGKKDFSACMGETLCALAEKDARICAVTAAMPSGTGLTGFAAQFPDRFFDVGIAEEHAVAMAAGMAAQGLLPVAAIYSTFLQRAYDQIVHDVAIARLHVIFCVDRAGIVGADGATHNGVLDIAFLRSVPGVKIFLPANFAELRSMLSRAIYHEDGPVAIRYPRGGEGDFCTDTTELDIVRVRQTAQPTVSLLSYGTMIEQALAAAELLEKRQIFAEVWKLNALDDNMEQMLTGLTEQLADWCVVIEDVVQSGSVGELIASHHKGRTDLLNTGDRFLPHGSVQEIYRHCGIDAESIADFICQEKGKGETAHG